MDFDFLRYRGLQGKPSGIFWTKFVDLQQCAPPPLISCSSQLFIAKGLATVCPDWFITTRGNCNWLLQQYNLEKLFFSTDSLQTKKNCDRKQECHEQIIALSIFLQLWITKIHTNSTINMDKVLEVHVVPKFAWTNDFFLRH